MRVTRPDPELLAAAKKVKAALEIHPTHPEEPMKPPRRGLLTQAQYAARCGYSRTLIGKYIMLGKIRRRSVLVDESGRKWIDPSLADQDLVDNVGALKNNPGGHGRAQHGRW